MEKLLDVNVALELESEGKRPFCCIQIQDENYDDRFIEFDGFPTPDDLGKNLVEFLNRHYVKEIEEDNTSIVGDYEKNQDNESI